MTSNFSTFSLPYQFRLYARILYAISIVLIILDSTVFRGSVYHFLTTNTAASIGVGILMGIICVGYLFARLKDEDEILKNCRERTLSGIFFYYYLIIFAIMVALMAESNDVTRTTAIIGVIGWTVLLPAIYAVALHRALEKVGFHQDEIDKRL
jgi:hypothetical protein